MILSLIILEKRIQVKTKHVDPSVAREIFTYSIHKDFESFYQ